MSANLRIVLVDDEPLVRRGMRASLRDVPQLAIIGECDNGADAVAMLGDLRPDLVLLDVQMPDLDGFGVLQALGDERPPAVIFVTAHDAYAVRAFEEHAVDYLLKPFDDARLFAAIRRARDRLARGVQDEALPAVLQAMPAPPQRFVVRIGTRVVVVPRASVEWFEAADNYVTLHTGDGAYLVRETLTALERQLPAREYARSHRSAIVTLDRVRGWTMLPSGDAELELRSGARVPLSRTFRDAFLERLAAAGS